MLKDIGVELVQRPPTWTWPLGAETFKTEKEACGKQKAAQYNFLIIDMTYREEKTF